MTPAIDKRSRPFGETRKKVKVHGVTFNRYYVFHKVIISEPDKYQSRLAKWRRDMKLVTEAWGRYDKPKPDKLTPQFHGPYQANFDYAPFLPKQRNGRWSKGAWLPIIPANRLAMCADGYHVTTMSFTNNWNGGDPGAQIYLVEAVGPLTEAGKRTPVGMNWQYPGGGPKDNKYVFQSFRFIRRLDPPKPKSKPVKVPVVAKGLPPKRKRKKAA